MLSSLISTLALGSLAFAAPLVERDSPVTCKQAFTGALYLTPVDSSSGKPDVPVSILGGTFKHTDYTGAKASTFLTRGDSEAVVPDQFEFATCESTYIGEQQNSPENIYYGHLRPKGSSKHCATASAGTLTGAAQKQAFTDSVCPTADDFNQLWSYFSFDQSTNKLTFLEHPTSQPAGTPHKILISEKGHGQVQLYTSDAAPQDATVYQFILKN